MTRPTFTALPEGWALSSPDGVLEWVSGLRQKPKAIFHHAKPRWYDDEPMYCPTLGFQCYPDAGSLIGYYLRAWNTNNPTVIEAAMRAMWTSDHFESEVA